MSQSLRSHQFTTPLKTQAISLETPTPVFVPLYILTQYLL